MIHVLHTLFPLKHFKNSTTSSFEVHAILYKTIACSFEVHAIVLYSKPDVSMYRYLV